MSQNSPQTGSPSRRKLLRTTAMSASGLLALTSVARPAAAHRAWCPRTPGFWKNPRNWPDFITDDDREWVIGNLAGEKVYTKEEVIEILRTPPRGGCRSIIMAHQVIATKLNIHAGSDVDCIKYDDATFPPGDKGTLPAANDWLADADFWDEYEGGGVYRSWIADGIDGEPLKDRLDAYNNQRLEPECGCSEGD